MKYRIQQLATDLALGEGPVWCEQTQALLFVDIERKRICRFYGHSMDVMELPDMVGCVVPMYGDTIAAAVKSRIYKIDLQTQKRDLIVSCPVPEYLRFNDGKCDAAGRLWVGMMAADQSHPKAKGGGSLYCIERGKIAAQYHGFTIPNGMAWSADGKTFYHIDTAAQRINAYEVERGTVLKNKRTVAFFAAGEGAPDGMCMDTKGNLWVALWGGYGVVCLDPATGVRLQRIDVPDKHVSCCTFGGDMLQTLFITTARDETGDGGNLWSVETDSKGVLPNRYQE